MFAVVTPEKIELSPGTVIRFSGGWQDYQALLQQSGDRQLPRIKYRPGEILLMSPLPKHGRDVHTIAHTITVLLDVLGKDYEAFTPITMTLPERSGIEPDYCFYIDNWQAAAGKDRIDWIVDPPPDLVVEIDVTHYTDVNDYLPYRVPEVWLFKKGKLIVYGLQGERYVAVSGSRYFPGMKVSQIVQDCLQRAYDENTSAAIRALRRQLRGN